MNEQLSDEEQIAFDKLGEELAILRANPPLARSRGSVQAPAPQREVRAHREQVSNLKRAMKSILRPHKVKKQGAPVSLDLELIKGQPASVLVAPTNGEIEKLKVRVMGVPLDENAEPKEEITITLIQTSADRLRQVHENHGIPVNGASPDFGLLTVVEDESYDIITDADVRLVITYLFRSLP